MDRRSRKLVVICGLATLFGVAACMQGKADEMKALPSATLAPPALPIRTVPLGSAQEQEQLRAAYEKARGRVLKTPQDMASWLQMAEVLLTEARITGNHTELERSAIAILDHVLGSHAQPSVRAQALGLKATAELTRHHFAEALGLGKEALVLDPHSAYLYGVLVDANVELGNYDEAVRMSDKMISMRPDLRSYSRVSYLRELHGDIPGAVQAMDMAVKAGYPGMEETSWCRTMLGRLYEGQGDLARAQEQYTLATEERENYPPAMVAQARIHSKQGEMNKALVLLEGAAELMPEAGTYEALARTYGAMGRSAERDLAVEKAESLLQGLANTKSTAPNPHGHGHEVGLEMGRFELEFKGNLDAALHHAHHELEARPNNIEVCALVAAVHYARGEMDDAATYLARAQRTGHSNAMLQCLGGLIVHARGDAQGKTLLKEAFRKDPFQTHLFAQEAKAVL
jgi:tetratricopeptide (TPR) repeat protein